MGDLNFRVTESRKYADELIETDRIDKLLESDELSTERAKNTIFNGFYEAKISFMPTYKFDVREDIGPRKPTLLGRIFKEKDKSTNSSGESLKAKPAALPNRDVLMAKIERPSITLRKASFAAAKAPSTFPSTSPDKNESAADYLERNSLPTRTGHIPPDARKKTIKPELMLLPEILTTSSEGPVSRVLSNPPDSLRICAIEEILFNGRHSNTSNKDLNPAEPPAKIETDNPGVPDSIIPANTPKSIFAIFSTNTVRNQPLAPVSRFGYDSSAKQRTPAWTDRILFTSSTNQTPAIWRIFNRIPDKLSCFNEMYQARMEINSSDHKPVVAKFLVMLPPSHLSSYTS